LYRNKQLLQKLVIQEQIRNIQLRNIHIVSFKAKAHRDIPCDLKINRKYMKQAWPYGVLIGILSGIWIFVIQKTGGESAGGILGISWMEYLSVLIPFFGLYFGISHYKNTLPDKDLTFFRAFVQGFMILLVGGVLAGLATAILLQYERQPYMDEYMGRIAAALLIGILLNLAVSLWFMNRPRNL